MFKYMNLNPTNYWKLLIFKDEFNYVGIDEF
jgi:hypothetical protein